MRRKFVAIDINELNDADDINRTTIKGEMRNLYPAIHKKLVDGGWSAKDMVAWLSQRGIKISVELFRVYLRDIDRENGYKRSSKNLCDVKKSNSPMNQVEDVTQQKNVLEEINKLSKPSKSADTTVGLKNEELIRPPGITDVGWSEMKAKARAEKRKQKLN